MPSPMQWFLNGYKSSDGNFEVRKGDEGSEQVECQVEPDGNLVSEPGANGEPTGGGLGHGCTRCTGGRNEIGHLPSTPQ